MLFLGLFLLFASEPPANAQEALTNDDVIKMVAARMAPNLIVQMIQTQPGSYSLNPADIDQLQRQGVPKDIISAMQDKSPIMSKAPEAIQSNATQKKPGGPRMVKIFDRFEKARLAASTSPLGLPSSPPR